MGCSFNCVVVPPSVQNVRGLRKFYGEYRDGLLMDYGGDFEGYTGDMAVDDGYLEVRKDLVLDWEGEVPSDSDEVREGVMGLIKGVAEKWGPSIAVRVGGQWVICGFYSD